MHLSVWLGYNGLCSLKPDFPVLSAETLDLSLLSVPQIYLNLLYLGQARWLTPLISSLRKQRHLGEFQETWSPQ